MTANERLFDLTIRGQLYLEQVANREVAKLVSLMEKHTRPHLQRLLDLELARMDRTPSVFKTRRYRAILRSADAIIDAANETLGEALVARMDAVADATSAQAARYMTQAIPLDMTFNTPSPAILAELVRARPYDGELLKDWAKSVGGAAKQAIRRQLNIGMSSGEPIEQITRRIMGDSRAMKAFKGSDVMAQQRRNVRSIVRTMANGIGNGARQATFEANADVLKGVQWVSTLDARTTDICASRDGQVYGVTEGPRPPAHHQCRSTVVPVTKSWRELGINAKDKRLGGRSFRDVQSGISGRLPDRPNYPQWLRRQPREVQVKVLGERRTRLLRGNRIKADDLYRNDRLLTVEELAGL